MTRAVATPFPLASRLIRFARRGAGVLLLAALAACGSGNGLPSPLASIDTSALGTGAALDPVAPADPVPSHGTAPPPPASATPASDPILAPSAPAVSVTAVSGALKLAWTASTDASSYRVQKQLDGGSWLDDGPSLDPTTFAADRSVPVAQWARTRFRVQACNTAGCTTSADMQAAASMAATLRYLKASNTGAGDLFGGSVALSADGNTLAVGAFDEDSAETGTAGTGADNSAPDSGAVYVF
jgi:hypothetical protein